MKPNLTVSLDALSKVFDECLKDDLLKAALKHYDDHQIKDLKDLVIANLHAYAMYYGDIRSLTPVSVYRHIQYCVIVLFRITRRRKYASFKPLYFVVFMSDFKIIKSTNLSLQNASSFYTLLVDGMRIQSTDTKPFLPF